MRNPFTISSSLEIEKNGMLFLNARRIELLKRVKSTGSMLAASKEMSMSYQQAWNYIQQMNELSPVPLVIRKRGGTNGGGAEVTHFGEDIIKRFDKLIALHNEQTRKIGDEMLLCIF